MAWASCRPSSVLERVNRRWADALLGLPQRSRPGPGLRRADRLGARVFPARHAPPPPCVPAASRSRSSRLANHPSGAYVPAVPQAPFALPRRPAGPGSPSSSSLLRPACTAGDEPDPSARRPALLAIPSVRRTYWDVLMTRLTGDGQARPKRPLPAGQGLLPALAPRDVVQEGGMGAGSLHSGHGGSNRPGRSPEYYSGTSLRRPPPPRDPARDPRLPLPGSPGTVAAWRPPARSTWTGKRLCVRSWLRVPLRHLSRVMSQRPAIPRLGTSLTAPRHLPGGVIIRITAEGSGRAGLQCGAVMMAAVPTGAPLGRRVRTGAGMTGLLGTCRHRPCLLLRFPPRPRQRRRRSRRRRRPLGLTLSVLAA
ncbi:uncharacterized protein LOC123425928 [Hordeum vulgare subsp. vulgare]|uniref:uncharacterized protein LOC123425928 n=1 Tax=Hordeum vulgare subsp. vulgare TaxID=112509 RepID=UPI001D1A4AC0|nr:uncharacterized protein LOC123425928 [Hordeum vulgare subsp. vulgare]